MKIKILVLLFLVSIFSFGQSENGIKLEVTQSKKYGKAYFILHIQNNTTHPVLLPKAIDGSFWCWTIPCINFIAETKIEDKWVPLNEIKGKRCGNHVNWEDSNNFIKIEPNERAYMGEFYFREGIEYWFGLVKTQKIRLSVEYIVGNSKEDLKKLKSLNIQPVKLVSNKIEIDYSDSNTKEIHDRIYQLIFEDYVSDNNIQKNDIYKDAKIIDRPKNSADALHKGTANTELQTKKWKLITTFYSNASVNGLPSTIMVFSIGKVKYYGISTKLIHFDKNDTSGKYAFKIIKTDLP